MADGLSSRNSRMTAVDFIEHSYNTTNTHVVPLSRGLIDRAIELYRSRPDKGWTLTDCMSFIVMQNEGLTEALTADRHFEQAGFRAVLREQATQG
ncbi:MAG: hypothetical protein O7E52_07455 [Candidatus Poribacteria bacterium]|nr:hypothetical protein [Candidatus Poribacteria bacterium]